MQAATSNVVAFPPNEQRAPERGHCTVMLVSGAEDGGTRATLAFLAALTAASMEQNTLLFLVGDGAHWAYEGHADGVRVGSFPALAELIKSFGEAGGQIGLCSLCVGVCSLPAAAAAASPRRLPGIHLEGMTSVLEHGAKGNVLTF